MSGFSEPTLPAMMKTDVKGFEMPLFRDMLSNIPTRWIPGPMLVEIHLERSSPARLPYTRAPWDQPQKRDFIRQIDATAIDITASLSGRGYQFEHQADNRICKCCTEVTLI